MRKYFAQHVRPSTHNNKGQTFVEYTLLLGTIASVLIIATPMIRRGIQSIVKTVADQVGNQANAEQVGGDFGRLIDTNRVSTIDSDRNTREFLGDVTYTFTKDEVVAQVNTLINQGLTPRPDF